MHERSLSLSLSLYRALSLSLSRALSLSLSISLSISLCFSLSLSFTLVSYFSITPKTELQIGQLDLHDVILPDQYEAVVARLDECQHACVSLTQQARRLFGV